MLTAQPMNLKGKFIGITLAWISVITIGKWADRLSSRPNVHTAEQLDVIKSESERC